MRVLREIRDDKDSSGKNNRYLCWTCNKCGGVGFFSVADDVTEIPEDRKKCCEE